MTTMQEWFNELKANYPYMANEIYQKGFKKYLEKEKEQIIKAHGTKGWYKPSDKTSGITTGEDYYNQNYNKINYDTNTRLDAMDGI